MHTRTRATLNDLERVVWFRSVGKHDTDACIVLASWDEAIESCSSDAWQDLLLEAANRYREQLIRYSSDRFNLWNDLVEEIKSVTMPLVEYKTAQVVQAYQLPEVFVDTVHWDILHVAMEAEYADVYQPGFYASQAYWYVKGHFPCGWQGSFPAGKLIIY